MIDQLLLPNATPPSGNAFSNLEKFCSSRSLGLVRDLRNFFNSGIDLPKLVFALLGITVDIVERSAEGLADSADLLEKLATVSENDKDVLVGRLAARSSARVAFHRLGKRGLDPVWPNVQLGPSI